MKKRIFLKIVGGLTCIPLYLLSFENYHLEEVSPHYHDIMKRNSAIIVPRWLSVEDRYALHIADPLETCQKSNDREEAHILASNFFYYAVKNKNYELMERLQAFYSIDPNFRLSDDRHSWPLYQALSNLDVVAVKKLFAWGARWPIPCQEVNDTPLLDPLLAIIFQQKDLAEHSLVLQTLDVLVNNQAMLNR